MQNLPLDASPKENQGLSLWIDGIDPRLSLLAVVIHAAVISSLNALDILSGLVFLSLVLCFLTYPFIPLLKRIMAMDGFLIFVLATLPLSVPPEKASATLWEGHFFGQALAFSETGLWMAVTIVLKANAILLFLTLMLGQVSVHKLCHALIGIKCPEKLVFLLALCLRYLSVIKQQFYRMKTAMMLRGFQLAFRIQSLKMLGFLIGMVLVRSLNRSERIYQSMQCRGFVDRLAFLPDFYWRPSDSLIAFLFIMFEVSLLGVAHHAVFI
ncbi:MAG: energy-coupling factor transporter transmembrane component T [Cellvibrionales bacterium]|nr:energy-coupling factor transporter transmembrane component T [Cellvibrionales bacterium]